MLELRVQLFPQFLCPSNPPYCLWHEHGQHFNNLTLLIELKAPNKPGVLRVGGVFTYVVMPVSLT